MTITQQVKKLDRVLLLICYGLYFLFVILLSLTTRQHIFEIVVGTLPILLYLVLMFSYFMHKEDNLFWIGVLPFGLSVLFFLFWRIDVIPVLKAMDGATLLVLNMFASYFFAFILLFHLPGEQVRLMAAMTKLKKLLGAVKQERKELAKERSKVTKATVAKTIRTIEDKCKAINFVIGRVYSDKRGGSKTIREQLAISRETYNAFSKLTKDVTRNRKEIQSVVEQIYLKLLQLEKKEFQLFKLPAQPQIPLDRDFFGHDPLLTVLAKNDKDPIEEYHHQAKQTCEDVMKFLSEYKEKKKLF